MDDNNDLKPEEESLQINNMEDESSDTPDEVNTSNDDTATLVAIESAIKLNISKLDRIKEDIKPVREMMKSYLENDEDYVKATEAAKKASQLKSARKRDLLETQNGKELSTKLTEFGEDQKEAEEALSYYLREYQRITGLNEFEGEDGELRQIVSVAKLVRKTNLNK